jgi:uncharacterized protein (TIGR02118 family)
MQTTPLPSPSPLARRNFLQLLGAGAATLGVVGATAATSPTPPAGKSAGMKLTVLYSPPKDTAAFEKYYAETHMPLARKMSGFTRLELSKGLPGPDENKPAAFHRMAEFWFESAAAMQACFDSPEAKAASDDLQNFATGGVTLFVSEVVG